MALAILDNLDGVAADLAKEYRPGTKQEGLEGKFVLKVDEVNGWALENVKSLKNSLSNAKTERDQAKAILKELGDDFTAEQYKKAMRELEDLKKGTGDDKVKAQIESVKQQLADKHKAELKAKDDELSLRNREVEELLIDSEATRALTTAGNSSTAVLLLPHVKQKCKVVRDSKGKPHAVVLEDDGVTPRLSMKQGSQDNMSIDEYVESLKTNKAFAQAFPGSGATGTAGAENNGSRGNNGQSGSGGAGGAGSGNNGNGAQGKSALDRLREHRRAEEAKRS